MWILCVVFLTGICRWYNKKDVFCNNLNSKKIVHLPLLFVSYRNYQLSIEIRGKFFFWNFRNFTFRSFLGLPKYQILYIWAKTESFKLIGGGQVFFCHIFSFSICDRALKGIGKARSGVEIQCFECHENTLQIVLVGEGGNLRIFRFFCQAFQFIISPTPYLPFW